MARRTMERRRTGPAGLGHRIYWELRRGRWGLLLLLAGHQAAVGVVLAWSTYVGPYTGVPVPLRQIWPGMFLLAAGGTLDIWRTQDRRLVNLAEGLMLLAYGSRAAGIWIAGVDDGWTTSAVVTLLTWAVMVGIAHRAWDQARATL